MKGKRIIVGGGATGIGAELAQRLVSEGASVCVGDVNAKALANLLPGLQKNGGKAMAEAFDLADEASIKNLVACCVAEFGGIDGLAITGADLSAANLGNDHDLMRMEPKVWERTLTVNLIGHALLMKAAIPHMVKAGGGSIVSVSSNAAFAGYDYMPAYAASKAGIHALIRHVARLCGKDKIRCNAVAPGLVLTDGAKVNLNQDIIDNVLSVITLPRLGEPDDLASAMTFLLSDDAAWLTGQVVAVNGGAYFRD